MNRRELLGSIGLGTVALAGCYGASQYIGSDGTDGSSGDESGPPGDGPAESPGQNSSPDNATDDSPGSDGESGQQDQENQSQDQEQEQNQSQSDGQDQSPPDEDAQSAVEILEHEPVVETPSDPRYGSAEFAIRFRVCNTSRHPLSDVRLDGYAYVGDQQVGHDHLAYASLHGGGEMTDQLPVVVEDPSQVTRYELVVTAAQWA